MHRACEANQASARGRRTVPSGPEGGRIGVRPAHQEAAAVGFPRSDHFSVGSSATLPPK